MNGKGPETEHFKHAELVCPCCGVNGMDEEFLHVLEDFRIWYAKPMKLSGAYRCPTHNREVSTTGSTGPHTLGKAVDILVTGEDAYVLLKAALRFGFTGIGINQRGPHGMRFIHLDNLMPEEANGLRPRVWTY